MTDIEKFLCEYSDTKKQIKNLELELEEIESKKNAQYDKLLRVKEFKLDRITGGQDYDPVIEAVSKLVDVYATRENKIADDLKAAMGKLALIEDVVNKAKLSETELRYVRLRYFENMKVWQVAQKIGYSERWSLKYKLSAFEKLEEVIA